MIRRLFLVPVFVCAAALAQAQEAAQPAISDAPPVPAATALPVAPPVAAPTDSPVDALAPVLPAAVLPVGTAAEAAPASGLPVALSPVEMFAAADVVVKAVMTGLIAASVLVWAIWLGKLAQIGQSLAGLRRGLAGLAGHEGLSTPAGAPALTAALIEAARAEAESSRGLPMEGLRERAASEVEARAGAAQRRLQRGIAVIGTVAATAPFIGLFGTVWGIMNSFIGIAESQQTNLAVVAPGIAEALLATGIGLVAAIPAVILYNHLTRLLAAHRAALTETARRINVILSRHLDRSAAAGEGARLHLAAE